MWFDTRMCSLVDLQIAFAIEGCPADLAHVWLLTGVDEQVAAEVANVSEHAVAVHALVRLEVCVANHVSLQRTRVGTNHFTHSTQVHHPVTRSKFSLHIRNISIFLRVAHIKTGSNFSILVRIFISFLHDVHPVTTNVINIWFYCSKLGTR